MTTTQQERAAKIAKLKYLGEFGEDIAGVDVVWLIEQTASESERADRAEAERDHFAKHNLEWANHLEHTQQENAGLRKRIHHLEGHNQYFFRCESAWCHPSDKQWGNPALDMLKGAVERADEAERQLAELSRKLQPDATVSIRFGPKAEEVLRQHGYGAETKEP